ncbi:hypothetical protein J4475_02685 [Candidatus Woesearchaeota archaeon]|nr:hypothetical protein [Candidatus Woesearchaeota archaeon]
MKLQPVTCRCNELDVRLGRNYCPVHFRQEISFKVKQSLNRQEFTGSSPAPFIGRYGYPNINVGVLSPAGQADNVWEFDAPKFWAEHEYQIPRIVEFRSSLINSRLKADARQPMSRLIEASQAAGMADRPVHIDVQLEKLPVFSAHFDSYAAPMGPYANLRSIRLTSNPHIPAKVEKVVSDKDLLAGEAVNYLSGKGFDENFLSRLLSVGGIGLGKNRKLVPTRWSITATDDIIAKKIIDSIKHNNELGYTAYYDGYLGNYFLVLAFPGSWSFELMETWAPDTPMPEHEVPDFMTDWEPFEGRKSYAENCGGGYYAARLAVLEYLKRFKRQASVLVIRFVTSEYTTPLGVWVVREAARKALRSKPLEFGSKELLLNYAKIFARKKFGYTLQHLLFRSQILRDTAKQARLTQFA